MTSERPPAPSKGSQKIKLMIVAVIVVAAALVLAYLGTGLSAGVKEWESTEISFVGVAFDVKMGNDGLFNQTKELHCEVRTTTDTYESVQSVEIAPGETVNRVVIVPILGLNTGDIVEKRCYTTGI